MRVKYVQFLNGQRVDVVLRPNWLARLFGARERRVELRWDEIRWVSNTTGERLSHMRWGEMITEALEALPVPDSEPLGPPVMRLLKGGRE